MTSVVVVVAMLLATSPARATPWAPPSSVSVLGPEAIEPASVEQSLEAGDLEAARARAREAREAEPSAARWQQQGQVLEQSGEYRAAADAYRAARDVAGDDAAAAAAADEGLARVKAAARGTVADEPASTHREELDRRWAPPPATTPQPVPEPEPEPEPRERIVTKWYFWITIGAIAASAAAVTVIAVRAAADEQPDALDASMLAPERRSVGVLRF